MSTLKKLSRNLSLLLIGVLIANSYFLLCSPAAGYISPADQFVILEGSQKPTIDGIRDTTGGTYPSTVTESGDYLDIWAYHYSGFVYWYIEIPGDSTDDDGDMIWFYFEKDHDNTLESGDEFIAWNGGGTGTHGTHNGDSWEISGSYTATVNDGLNDDVRTFEANISDGDCGWSTSPVGEFGLLIHYYSLNTPPRYTWPGLTYDSSNIDDYGEVVLTVPEFPTLMVPVMIVVVITIFAGIKQRKK